MADEKKTEVKQEEGMRYEDDPKNFPQDKDFKPAPVSAKEVDPEEARKDETTLLATDQVDQEGNIVKT